MRWVLRARPRRFRKGRGGKESVADRLERGRSRLFVLALLGFTATGHKDIAYGFSTRFVYPFVEPDGTYQEIGHE